MLKRPALVTGLLLFAVVLPLILLGALLALAGEQPSPSEKALEQVPPDLLPLYHSAAETCDSLDWTILAAIHRVETNFGRGAAISSKGAQGPMQFMPTTFRTYAVDGDGDGAGLINDVEDAVFSAANLLCANRAGDPERLEAAIWSYNHSDAYVAEVLTLANSYAVLTLAPTGAVSPSQFLANPRITLTERARADVAAGIVDSRLLTLLDVLSRRHMLLVTVFKTGHSMRTSSGSISNHYVGRGTDIYSVDGTPVGASNAAARQLVVEIAAIEGPLRPDEVGHPFSEILLQGGFTDADHRDHVHIGYD